MAILMLVHRDIIPFPDFSNPFPRPVQDPDAPMLFVSDSHFKQCDAVCWPAAVCAWAHERGKTGRSFPFSVPCEAPCILHCLPNGLSNMPAWI